MVEANPELYAGLAAEGSFPAYHCAVTDEEGSVRFNIARNDEGSSILALPADSEYNCVLRETVTVPARTAASLLREIGWDRVDLIKMDIEGAEIRVLDSLGPDVLDRMAQFSIEFHSDPVFRFGIERQVEDCLDRMRDRGFLVVDFTFPNRRDVLLINALMLKIPLKDRIWWRLMYAPPRVLDRLLRILIPVGLRKRLGRWRKRATGNLVPGERP
jgi:FkbM family methyltransferase